MHTAFDEIRQLADEKGISIAESEIVGLVPQAAITMAAVHYLSLRTFSQDQIIENRIFGAKSSETREKSLVSLSLEEFSEKVLSKSPTPGGGSVAAYSGALAASLVGMVCQLTINRKNYESSWTEAAEILSEAVAIRPRLLALVDEDASSYDQVSKAVKLPKGTDDERATQKKALVSALINAARVPAETAEFGHSVFLLAKRIHEIGNKNS